MKHCIIGLMALLSVTACDAAGTNKNSFASGATAPAVSDATKAAFAAPKLRWSGQAKSSAWTQASLTALQTHGARLPRSVPADIDAWCPAYRGAGPDQRRAFWAGFVSALTKHESTYRETAVGGGGQWVGLMQISPATARHYGCKARSAAALKNGSENLSCAIRIMSVTVPRDGVIAGRGRGVAADWGPMNSASKRSDMQSWLKKQPFCSVSKSS